MENKKSSVPKLRFPGFTGAWEQRKLGEVVKITMGQSPSSKNYTDNSSDYILVQGNADMKNGRVAPRVWTTQITRQAEKGDLILSVRAPVGDIGKTDYDVVIGRGVAAIKGNEYIFQILTKMKNSGYWTRFSTGSTFESINSSNIRNAQIMIPKDDEQTKIGHFLSRFDSLIALHQRKLEHLKEQKKGLLQKMFPKNGEVVPEVRFPGFTDDWEQRKLGEVAEKITKGTTPHDKRWFGPVNYVKTESIDSDNGNISVVANTSLEEHEGYLKRSQLEKDDVLFSIVGTLGRVGVVKKKDLPANTNQQICIIRPFKENSFFLLNALKTNRVKSFIKSDATIGAQPSLSLWQIEGLRIPFPILEEQQKIGKFFQQLDSLIALHQRKLEHLKLMKKGLLQQMFI